MTAAHNDLPEYVQRFDSVPEFWQFLRGLNQDDLVAELIQNELDANSTQTTILFGINGLTCQGNGDSVDKDGWKRLTYVRGAGDLVPRKHNRIGIKNHGIKACFTIGDSINIRSDGKMVNQTLYKDGLDQSPSPATYLNPVRDDAAPASGCLIEVPYRVKPLNIDSGEPLSFDPITDSKVQELFLRAYKEASLRFIGALRPDRRKRYVLELVHHELGTARFEFSCGRMRKIHGLNFYNRTCSTSGDVPELPDKIVESCCLFDVPIPKDSNKEIPEFYTSKGRYFLSEISWRTEGKNRPVTTRGHRRYPIEYRGNDNSARTGLGLNFSAPYVSDLERHGAVEGDAFNECIENACKSNLVKILRWDLIPRHGAIALNILIDPKEVNEETLREMVELMLDAGAFPVLKNKPIVQRDKKRSQNKKIKASVRFGPRKAPDGHIRRIVLPMFSWEHDKISPLLAKLCPSDEDQIYPSVPRPILKLLGDGDCEGWGDNHWSFDEADVINRFQPRHETGCFPWNNDNEWQKELGNPSIINLYLDTLMAIYENAPTSQHLGSLPGNVYLPDTTSTATPISKLYAGLNLAELPFGDVPPILHRRISSHRIFRKGSWKRRRFTFNEFLARANLKDTDEVKRKMLWNWLKNNWRLIDENPENPWTTLADLPIWPDQSGSLMTLTELCKPSKMNISTILEGSIKIPRADVLKVGSVRKAKRGSLHVRSIPTEAEVLDFLKIHLSGFPRDRALSEDEKVRFHSLENDLAELASDRVIRSYLKNKLGNAFALSKSGYIKPVGDLVQNDSDSKELYLVDDDIMERSPSVLDRIESWKPRGFPTPEQILRALEQDPSRYEALYRRLNAYLLAAKHEHKENAKADIIGIECIPEDGKLYAPGNLAFRSSGADYWGTWKHRISGKGLSADTQQLYKDIGILGTEPTSETSREFFEWLNTQGQSALAIHLPCILRHINHHRGPMSWSQEYPDIPFIPVVTDNEQISLTSRTSASSPKSMIFIPDHVTLAKAITDIRGNRGIRLVVHSHKSVTATITAYMQQLGVRSLRDFIGNPIAVQVQGPRNAPTRLLEEFKVLCGRKMAKELRKRLDSMGLPFGAYSIKNNWRERLLQIKSVNIVNSLEVTYKVGRYRYTIPADAALDESTSTIYLIDSLDNLDAIFYRTLAERTFENTSEYLAIILKEAVRKEFREKSVYSGPTEQPSEDGGEEGNEENGGEEDEGAGTEPGGTERTHGGGYPDPSKNIPNPGNIPTSITGTRKRHHNVNGGDGGKRESPRIEEIHIEDLKQKQYAWHCQICVTERTVEQLAPANSYVEIQENRRELIRAHHVDQVHAGGARHAGNILILCNYHHQHLGDRISRQDVIKALKETTSDYTVVFKTFIHDTTVERSVSGKITTITIPLEGKKIKCFFTKSHADYWLQKAPEGK